MPKCDVSHYDEEMDYTYGCTKWKGHEGYHKNGIRTWGKC